MLFPARPRNISRFVSLSHTPHPGVVKVPRVCLVFSLCLFFAVFLHVLVWTPVPSYRFPVSVRWPWTACSCLIPRQQAADREPCAPGAAAGGVSTSDPTGPFHWANFVLVSVPPEADSEIRNTGAGTARRGKAGFQRQRHSQASYHCGLNCGA